MASLREDNFKYTALSQRNFKDLLVLSSYFTFPASFIYFLIISLQIFIQKQKLLLIPMLYIVYFEFLIYNVLHNVRNLYWQTFLKG